MPSARKKSRALPRSPAAGAAAGAAADAAAENKQQTPKINAPKFLARNLCKQYGFVDVEEAMNLARATAKALAQKRGKAGTRTRALIAAYIALYKTPLSMDPKNPSTFRVHVIRLMHATGRSPETLTRNVYRDMLLAMGKEHDLAAHEKASQEIQQILLGGAAVPAKAEAKAEAKKAEKAKKAKLVWCLCARAARARAACACVLALPVLVCSRCLCLSMSL